MQEPTSSVQSTMSTVYTRPPSASGLMEPQPRRMQQMFDGQMSMGQEDVTMTMARPVLMSRRSSYSQQDGLAPDLAGDVANKLSLLDSIVSAAKGAREALLRGEDGTAHDKLGDLGNQLEIVGELGVGPAFSSIPRSGECTPAPQTPAFHSPSIIASISSSGTNSAPPTLLPSLIPQEVPRTGAKRAAPPLSPIDPLGSAKYMRVDGVNDFLSVPGTGTASPNHVSPPPLIHSHSFPNGHQLPSQASHTTNGVGLMPSTPPSLVAGVQQQHAPLVPSPLASHPVSRPASPPVFLTGGQQLVWPQEAVMALPTAMQLQVQFQQQQQQLHEQHQQQLAQHDAQFQVAQAQAHAQVAQAQAAQAQAQIHAQAQVQAQAQQAQAQAQAQVQAQAQAQIHTHHDDPQSMSRSGSLADVRADGLPVVRARSSSVGKAIALASMAPMAPAEPPAPPSSWRALRQTSPQVDELSSDSDDPEASDSGAQVQHRSKRRRSSVGNDLNEIINPHGGELSHEVKTQLDSIFYEFLNKVCSDTDIRDSKGEKLHQVLMPKKMQRLDESTDFRPFKFRIQAFCNCFQEDLAARGITEETMSTKKVKLYLWTNSLISRFNPDGKKAKSKGNHIWNIDAKKLPNGGWVFREFARKIIGEPPAVASIGSPYSWNPKIWDPQASSSSIKTQFSSPTGALPSWLSWERDYLRGTPLAGDVGGDIVVHAKFVDGSGIKRHIEQSYKVLVVNQSSPQGISSTPVQMYPQPGQAPNRRIVSEPFMNTLPPDLHKPAEFYSAVPALSNIDMAFTQGGPPSFLLPHEHSQ